MARGSEVIEELRPFDPTFYAGDPYPVYARLRREDPVHRVEDGVWALLRHADILEVSRQPDLFCSRYGVLPMDREREVLADQSILFMDPPEHLRHRKLVSAGFQPRVLPRLEPHVRELTGGLLEELDADGPVEFVDRVAAPLPAMVIAELLGIPRTDWELFRVWSDAMIAAATSYTQESLVKAAELYGYFREILAQRRDHPRDDMVSILAHAEVDGERLREEELLGFCMTLLVAGNETTRNLIAGGTYALAIHPNQRALLIEDPTLVPAAVEEILRWWTPVMVFARTATRETRLRDKKIAEGDYVLMLYSSANRDEDVFGPTAARFDVGRAPNDHIAFGFGEHFCLGAFLARLEARVLFEELLARWPNYELAGPVEPRPSVLMRGLARLPLAMR